MCLSENLVKVELNVSSLRKLPYTWLLLSVMSVGMLLYRVDVYQNSLDGPGERLRQEDGNWSISSLLDN